MAKINAKEELLSFFEGREVKFGRIGVSNNDTDIDVAFDEESNIEEVLEILDFEYDNGYGHDPLKGIVVFGDSWIERREYDGAGWWELMRAPTKESVFEGL